MAGKNWSPFAGEPAMAVAGPDGPDQRYARPTPVSYDVHITSGTPLTIARAGNESVRKPKPGKVGSSVKPGGLIVVGVAHPAEVQWSSMTAAEPPLNSSHAIQKPP